MTETTCISEANRVAAKEKGTGASDKMDLSNETLRCKRNASLLFPVCKRKRGRLLSGKLTRRRTSKDAHLQKKKPDPFPKFQCYICPYFSPSCMDFAVHLTSSDHVTECGDKTVLCNSANYFFRTSSNSKMIDHLERHNYHWMAGNIPACLLTYGTFGTLMTDDTRDALVPADQQCQKDENGAYPPTLAL